MAPSVVPSAVKKPALQVSVQVLAPPFLAKAPPVGFASQVSQAVAELHVSQLAPQATPKTVVGGQAKQTNKEKQTKKQKVKEK